MNYIQINIQNRLSVIIQNTLQDFFSSVKFCATVKSINYFDKISSSKYSKKNSSSIYQVPVYVSSICKTTIYFHY